MRWLRRLGRAAAALAVVLAGGAVWALYVSRGPRYAGPAGEPLAARFEDGRFHNVVPIEHRSFGEFLRWRLDRRPDEEVWSWREVDPAPPPQERVEGDRLRVTFVNHATVLVQLAGLNVLTDPIWSERTSPVSWAGPRRYHAPGVRFEDLPPIDVVLLSHNHYDHLDLPTLERLADAFAPRVLVGLGSAPLVERAGLEDVRELDWWEEADVGKGVSVAAVPAQHFSGRGPLDRDATLWCGFVLRAPAGTVYFAGDTGWGPHFEEIRARYGPPRLALLPVGAFLPRWFMRPVHVSPEEALAAHRTLGAGTSLAIHFATFPLGDDGPDLGPARLRAALAAAPEPARFWIPAPGEARDVP